MACKGCGGSASARSAPQPTVATMERNMNDADYVMITYNGNLSEHPVWGATKKFYGVRKKGESFLVHIDDVRAYPSLFIVSDTPTSGTIPVRPVAERPSSRPIKSEVDLPAPKKINLDDFLQEAKEAQEEVNDPDVLDKAIEEAVKRDFDLSALPGVTPSVERELRAAGISSPKAILDAGIEGLKAVKYVADSRAAIIYRFVEEQYG